MGAFLNRILNGPFLDYECFLSQTFFGVFLTLWGYFSQYLCVVIFIQTVRGAIFDHILYVAIFSLTFCGATFYRTCILPNYV
jgi:hypothetical protein